MACKVVGKLCKEPGENLPVPIDLTDFCERRWNNVVGAGIYPTGTFVRPTPLRRTGYQYEATTGGQVGVEEPSWPTTIGETVQDGSVEWTCRAIGDESLLKTIVADSDGAVEWDGDGFDVTDEDVVNTGGRQIVSCFIGGDLVAGKYTVKATVEFSDGHVESFGVQVKVD